MCTCFRNWEGADCSQRTCPFDLAHVDTPKGDLNMDGTVQTSATTVAVGSTVYPTGTQEQWPLMTTSAGTALTHSAHQYMECSNKGLCDRSTGSCECFDGYDGTACQRASCSNDCSGHGTCETIADLAKDSFNNIYALWDKDATMGCNCDANYVGADCSSRQCKYGVDPLYSDDTTIRTSKFSYSLTASASALIGSYTIKFYDVHGEDYTTASIDTFAVAGTAADFVGATACAKITAAFAALPDDVTRVTPTCTVAAHATSNTGYTISLEFRGQPGYLRPIEVADATGTASATMALATWTDRVGEFTDDFASKCSGVTVNVHASQATLGTAAWGATTLIPKPGSLGYLAAETAQMNLLKACLGDSDGDTTNNVDVYNWDYGNVLEKSAVYTDYNTIGSFPHAIKTVPVTQADEYASGEFHLVWWDSTRTAGEEMRVANLAAGSSARAVKSSVTDYDFYVHTTSGKVQQLGIDSAVGEVAPSGTWTTDKKFTADRNETRLTGYFSQYSNLVYTNFDGSCETGSSSLHSCINKGDKLFIVDSCWGAGVRTDEPTVFGGSIINAGCTDAATGVATNTGNLYTVNKIYSKAHTANTTAYNDELGITTADHKGEEDRYVIQVDQKINWDGSEIGNPDNSEDLTELGGGRTGLVVLFKFTPATDGSAYTYVSECSNRGACDRESGLCACFKGYTSDNCSVQSALAL